MALLLELCNRVGLHDQAVKSGEWMAAPDWSFWKTPLIELKGKTIGIVGFGRIGRRVGELAHAFGMNILAYDPLQSQKPPYEPFAWAELDELFSTADVITLHTPLTPDLEGIVNSHLLGSAKPGALFINASRGGLVVEQDLAEALNSGILRGAALDVVSLEPIQQDNPLLKAKNVFITPHIAWATLEARRRLLQKTAENIRAFMGDAPINVVNTAHLKSRPKPGTAT
jgi:glycerate dehydrogenase